MSNNPLLVVGTIIIVAVCSLALIALTRTIIFSSQFVNNVANQGTISITEGLKSDTQTLEWGELTPGENKTLPVTLTNEAANTLSLTYQTVNWTPQEAANYLTVTWNYDNTALAKQESRQVNFTLTISPETEGIENFSFDIQIIGEQA